MRIEFSEKEVELLQMALRQAQTYAMDKAFEDGRPQDANDYATKLQKIIVRLQKSI